MKALLGICVLIVIASSNDELTLEEKRIENAMYMMAGEEPPHDVQLNERNSLHDLMVSSMKEAMKRRMEGGDMKKMQQDHLDHADDSQDSEEGETELGKHGGHENHTDHGAHQGHQVSGNQENHKDHMNHKGNENHENHTNHKDHQSHKHHSNPVETFEIEAQKGHVGHQAHVDHAAHVDHKEAHSAAHAAHNHDHSNHVMMMYFHFGCNEVILFDFWRINSPLGCVISCVIIFAMGAFYEGLKWFRVHLTLAKNGKETESLPTNVVELQGKSTTDRSNNNAVEVPLVNAGSRSRTPEAKHAGPFSFERLSQALLYTVQLVVAYWLMLIVMTYNYWLTAAVILGAGFGHWLFAALRLANPDGEAADHIATDACH